MINHTMLENYQPNRHIKPQASPFSPTQTSLINKLHEEINQYKVHLSLALSINHLLVQQACTHHDTHSIKTFTLQTQSVEHSHEFNAVKMEEDLSESPPFQQEILDKEQKNKEIRDKNQTKNIPKNYGKAILSFIQKNIKKYNSILKPILEKQRLNLNDLLSHIKRHKREVNSINYLKQIWGYYDKCNPILKCIRILSYIFMRKHCLSYIFNSRVKNYFSHIKYRRRIIEGIQHPQEFTCIKQF